MKKLILRATVASAILLGAVMIVGGPSYAAEVTSVAAVSAVPEIALTLDLPQLLNLIIAVVFPVLVGLVTTRVTAGWVKSVLLATISLGSGLVTALLAAVLAGVPFDVIGAFLTGLTAWIIAIATHFGFWKPTGGTDWAQDTLRYTKSN